MSSQNTAHAERILSFALSIAHTHTHTHTLTMGLLGFVDGLWLPVRSAWMIVSCSRLRLPAVAPFVAYCIIVTALWLGMASSVLGVGYYSTRLVDILDDYVGYSFVAVAILFMGMAIVMALVISGLATMVALGIIVAPVLEKLSRRAEEELERQRVRELGLEPTHFTPVYRKVATVWLAELCRVVVFVFAQALASLLYITPLAIVAPAVTIVGSAVFLLLNYTAYSMDRRVMSYSQRVALLRRDPSKALGLAFAMLFLSSVPFVTFLVLPCCVVAGTLLTVELLQTAPHGRIDDHY